MSESLTLGLVEVEMVKEAIKFLYGQAGEAIKRWREHRAASSPAAQVPADKPLPAIFEAQGEKPLIHLATVGKLETDLKQIRSDLADYADDTEEVTPENPHLLEEIDALRRMLEAIYQQPLTFRGEQRPASEGVVEGRVNVEMVAGYVAGVRARSAQAGFIRGTVEAKNVAAGAEAVGVDLVG
jgi:hypothetical protein